MVETEEQGNIQILDGFNCYGQFIGKDKSNRKLDQVLINIVYEEALLRKEGRKYDDLFFDIDGFLYVLNPKKNQYEKTDRTVNDDGFNYKGNYCELQPDGTYKDTKQKYSPDGVDIYGESYEDYLAKKKAEEKQKKQQEREIMRQELMEKKLKKLEEKEEAEIKRKEALARRREESAKRREEEEKRKKVEKEKREKQKAEKLQAAVDKRNDELKEFKSKFDENGRCTTNYGLRYDENFFLASGTHVVTKKRIDFRGFTCQGVCTQNGFQRWDKNGFLQDGTHRLTGEKYYNGYNAYGLDENGKGKSGIVPTDIRRAQEFLKVLFDKNSPIKLNDYVVQVAKVTGKTKVSEVMDDLKATLYKACDMYPKLRTELEDIIKKQKEILEKNYIILAQKQGEEKKNQVIINMYKKMIDNTKDKLGYISYEEGEK